MKKNMKLDDIAKIMDTHPRTILRAVTGEENPYWATGHNPDQNLDEFFEVYNIDPKDFARVVNKKDVFLKPKDAASFLNISPRTFRYRNFKAAARYNGVVRYSRKSLITEKIKREVKKSKRL
jgi:hypothetical protein